MDPGQTSARERLALWASTAAIALVLVAHEPGRIVPETKLDVVLDPFGMLARALSAWDPSAAFGRVQNQAVGYLAPMGAWSALCRAVGIPPWLGQRIWLAAVVALGLWGAHRVARAIGIGSAPARLVAAWAYALAPATVSITFFQSAGQLPYALVPHVLAALMAPGPGATPRRTAARSTLWIAAMGGVNGASAIAVLPLVGLWFATRRPGADRRALLRWWCGGAVAATLWWAIPLLVSVRYGLRFTDHTESSAVTTITESATEVLRGTGNWLSYLETSAGSWLPGGWALASSRLAIVATIALAAAALAGLARRDAPERTWLVLSLLVGATAMGVGYAGAAGGPFALVVQDALDGPLAPLRNVHKFAAVVRLPLALGLGHAVAVAGARRASSATPAGSAADPAPRRPWRIAPTAAAPAAVAGLVVVLAIAPALGRDLTAPGSFEDVPSSWRQAAAWLEDEVPEGGRALVLPGSSFGEYRWGRPLDEPFASVLDADWAVRDLVPLGGDGSTRLLDGIDRALQGDALPDGFVPVLQRAGISHLVVRNDLDLDRTGGPRPATVRRLLQGVEGMNGEPVLDLVASFGPVAVAEAGDGRRPPLPGTGPGGEAAEAFRDVDVYAVPDATEHLATYPAAGGLVVSGGPEALLGLDAELLGDRAVVLAVDDDGAVQPSATVATDTARRRDVELGAVRDSGSYVLAGEERSPLTGDAPFDRWPAGEPRGTDPIGLTVAVDGEAAVRDSREADGRLTPEGQPFAAFDGNPDTAWVPQRGEAGEWLEVVLDAPRDLGGATISLRRARPDAEGIRSVDVVTDAGRVGAELGADGRAEAILPAGPTDRVRIVVTDVGGNPDLGTVGLASVEIEGVEVRRPLQAAPLVGDSGGADEDGGARAATAAVLQREHRDRLDRVRRDEDGRFDRIVDWAGGSATIDGRAVLGEGAAIDRLLEGAITPPADPDLALTATASSRYRDHPATDPRWAADGDPTTAWVSDTELGAPELALAWSGPVRVDALVVDALEVGVDQIGEVEVVVGDRRERHRLDAAGRIVLDEPVVTDGLVLSFPGPDEGAARRVGVAEVEVPALFGRSAATPDRSATIELTCGEGPELRIDGAAVATRSTTTAGALLDGTPVRWESCEPVDLPAGSVRIDAARGALFASTIRLLPAEGLPAPTDARSATVERWEAEDRRVALDAGPATIVATTENANDGWTATFDGEPLTAIRIDGWRQGWLVPEGAAGQLELRYGPGQIQRGGLLLGALAIVALVGAAAAPSRWRGSRSGAGRAASSVEPLAPRPTGRRTSGLLVASSVGAAFALAPLGGVLVLAAIGAGRIVPGHGPVRWALRAMPVLAAVGAGAVAFAGAGAGLGTSGGTFSAAAQVLAATAIGAVGAVGALRGVGAAEPERAEGAGGEAQAPTGG